MRIIDIRKRPSRPASSDRQNWEYGRTTSSSGDGELDRVAELVLRFGYGLVALGEALRARAADEESTVASEPSLARLPPRC
jgi:hypothetical protein